MLDLSGATVTMCQHLQLQRLGFIKFDDAVATPKQMPLLRRVPEYWIHDANFLHFTHFPGDLGCGVEE